MQRTSRCRPQSASKQRREATKVRYLFCFFPCAHQCMMYGHSLCMCIHYRDLRIMLCCSEDLTFFFPPRRGGGGGGGDFDMDGKV